MNDRLHSRASSLRNGTLDLRVGRTLVQVPVSLSLRALFLEQFVHGAGTDARALRLRTLHRLMEAAYEQGRLDARRARSIAELDPRP